MKRCTLLVLVMASLAGAGAVEINHDAVTALPQPEPTTAAEKAAVKFKPSLFIEDGCYPYPAVNAAGETSAGLKPTGKPDQDCKGSALGSQVYSRSMLYRGKWAILYAWYFPKDVTEPILSFLFLKIGGEGRTHRWVYTVVWLDDVALEAPSVLAISSQEQVIEKPVDASHLDGTTTKVAMMANGKLGEHYVVFTSDTGEFQDLIQWEQMTDEAREALTTTDFGQDDKVPFIDANFEKNLKDASTYYVRKGTKTYHTDEPHSIWE